MKLGDLSDASLSGRLRGEGLYLRFGPFVLRVHSDVPAVASHLRLLYPAHEVTTDEPAESSVAVMASRGVRQPWEPEATLQIDRRPVLYPLHRRLAIPMLEWGMNWVVAARSHQYLLIHSATVEKNGRVAILPAASGSGKSTLCSLLLRAGWRLLSDEFAIIRLEDGVILPMPRAVSLKNASVAVVKNAFPEATFSMEFTETVKGTLCFMAAPRDAVERSASHAPPGLLVFPRYDPDTPLIAKPMNHAAAHAHLVSHSMNYGSIGERGFTCVADIIERTPAWAVAYSDVPRVLAWFDEAIGPPP
jgi:HprK-related kinase A